MIFRVAFRRPRWIDRVLQRPAIVKVARELADVAVHVIDTPRVWQLLATAVQFAREGARLTLSDRDTVRGEETLSAVRAVGGTAQFIYGDVVSEPFVQHLVDAAVKTYGRLDCAFNNAGIIGWETTAVDQFSLETWQNVIAVNLTSVFLCLKYEARAMLRTGGGAIVNTSSALGHVAAYNMPAYCASKAGVVGLTRATRSTMPPRTFASTRFCPQLSKRP